MEINNLVIEFDYNIESLNNIKLELESIDFNNIGQVNTAKNKVVKVRRSIEEKGKSYRDESNAFNKRVLTKEKEYIAIIEPLETKLKQIIEDDKQKQILEARITLLPRKRDQLSVLEINQPTDEEILAMDDEEWISFYDTKFAEHKVNIQKKEEDKKRKEQEERDRIERDERIKKETEDKAEKEKQDLLKKAEEDKIKAVAEEKAKAEKAENDRLAKIEFDKKAEEERLAKLENDKKYQKFLESIDFDPKDCIIKQDGKNIKVYKFIGEYNSK